MLPLKIVLPSGVQITVRHLMSADRKEFVRAFGELSSDSVGRRFHSRGFRPTAGMLDYLTQVDQVSHLAICATVGEGPNERGIAVARCVSQAQAETAELAVTVLDAWQGRGVGATLVGILTGLAERQGIRHFSAYVEAERRTLLARLHRLGARVTRIQEGVAEMSIPLAGITSRSSAGYRSGSA